jgi:alkaline phosphatase D
LYADETSIIKPLLLGIPNWREGAFSYLSIGVNVLLALLAVDLVFRAPLLHPAHDLSFTRVGYIDSNSAKVLIREPDPAQFPIYVYLSPADKTAWRTTDTIYYMGPDTDYTYALSFDGLQPSKKYIYSLSNDKSGTFTTAPPPYSRAANSLTFLTSSCIKANFPYRITANSLAFHGFDYLSNVVRSLPSPASFMLFLGDFIYVDVPIRLSSSLAHYRAEYRRVYASPSWSLPGLDTLPWIHTLDDHEIANDWSSGNDTEPFPAASDPFIHYHVSVNPPVPAGSPTDSDTNTTFFQFSNGPASFFMLDTRRYRTDPEPKSTSTTTSQDTHSMLGAQQLSSLLTFLATPEPEHVHWKIIASSVPFTKNWRFGTSDTWGGFLAERSTVLQAMHDAERELGIRVVILSGDRHEFAAIRYPPPVIATLEAGASFPADSATLESAEDSAVIKRDETPASGPHEFSCGPLSMFYLPIRTFKQIDAEDVAIKYIPDGNSKVGVVDIRNLRAGETGFSEGQRSLLKYTLFVDGVKAWDYTMTSPSPAGGRGRRSGRGSRQGWKGWFGRTDGGRSSLWD